MNLCPRVAMVLLFGAASLSACGNSAPLPGNGASPSGEPAGGAVDASVVGTGGEADLSTPAPPPVDGGAVSLATDGAVQGGLPAHVLVTYYWPFNGGVPSIDDLRSQPASSSYNVLSYVSAMGDGSGSGTVTLNGAPTANLGGQLAGWKASGRFALLMISHANNLHLTNPTQVAQFVQSVSAIVNQYGFQGIDWDLEDSGEQSNQASIVDATKQLKASFGPQFIVSAVPRYYEVRTGGSMLWSSILKALGSSVDLIAFQEYDNTVYADPSLAQIKADYADAIAQGFPATKLLLGTSTLSGVSVQGGAATAGTYASAIQSLAASYPGFRGATVWQSLSDQSDAPSFGYASALGNALGL
jgi:hypothetical protein